ncbi:hypothetical protein FACS1894187_04690 [Synergistales bacterium]|nr:hypothetical protein FACS1894187_04690 [Synergistales bacterium]
MKKGNIKVKSKPWSVSRSWGALEAASFLCGAAVMVLEMAGSRVVAPYMGTSLVVWTALIGVIMASLSLGYWLGGRLSDRRPERKLLARVVFIASVLTFATALLANPILMFFSRFPIGLYFSATLGALLLFAPPSVLLGMVSPFIVRLAMLDVGTSGSTVGRFSALSSAGSILGTFLGGFVLISLFASGTILLLTAAVLAFVAAILYHSSRQDSWKGASIFCITFLTATLTADAYGLPMMPRGEHMDTQYNHIWVAEQTRTNGRRARYLMTGSVGESAQSVMYTDNPTELASDYTKFYDLAFHYKPDVKKILMLGGGAYCVPRHLLAARDVSVDVVEIDPGITETARKYFYLRDNPNLTIYHEDARTFLNRAAEQPASGKYDAVFADVFGSWYSIPFHVTTVETAQRMYNLLPDDGVLISNVISAIDGPKSGVLRGIYAAVSQVFPQVMIFPAQRPEPQFAQLRQNVMIVALKRPASGGDIMEETASSTQTPEITSMLTHLWSGPFSPTVPFTDAFAPVERLALME